MRSDTVRVPGATLYYEVRGKGPVLLLIPGGGGDANAADGMAEVLERHFTVVAFDARGYSRSTLDGGTPEPQHVAVQSDDAFRLLTHLTDEPAYVYGGSHGAIVGLDLLARHPDRIRALVAHEPPCFAVLPDAAEHRAMIDDVYRLFRTDGLAAAAGRFLTAIGGAIKPGPELSPMPERELQRRARSAANAPIMMEHELREFTSYIPDYEALAPVADRLTLAVGQDTRGCLPYRPAVEIAERLALNVTEFPGAHNGTLSHSQEVATELLQVLAPGTTHAEPYP
ncbi:alpha/beta fold hydrolase [Nocardia yunnanensis]|uniref:Alpha/beta fold hydrolase n=1 Tax=Nocardia yunnanensis TaxID=2382165 RepID=A0A386ZLL8_9NOCA|nr:alpha/beta fold hydrolase [Nocardia yunnanensis]AYF78054.1 alpha/beta fold hydrolase [Nocardia yunnanensis]